MSEALRSAARAILAQAMAAVDVRAAVQQAITIRDGQLTLCGRSVRVDDVSRVLIVAIGKAAVPMHAAAQEMLAGLRCRSVVVAPIETLPLLGDERVTYLAGAHPIPTADSFRAADAALRLLEEAEKRTVVLFLVSGGASAMMERPLDAAITMDDVAGFHRALVGSGLPIAEMNTLRKHMSAVKGGRLAVAAAHAAMQCTLLVSDVPLALPDAIGSGPSLPDSTTVAQARSLFKTLDAAAILPGRMRAFFLADDVPETPKASHAAFAHASWEVILSSDHLAQAALEAAEAAGFHAFIDNRCDEWDYREAGRYLLDASAALALQHPRSCLVSVGEVGVTLPADPGEGGRNSQLALWCAAELAHRGQAGTVLSAGSDGIDGQSAAAGAVCDTTTLERAAAMGFDTQRALDACDSGPLLRAIGDAVVTGPTGNNLRDLRLVITDSRIGR